EDLDEVLQQIDAPTVGAEELLNEDGSFAGNGNGVSDDSELDLSAGVLDKASDPVRLYMREMGQVPLLKREQEVSIAKRIEWGQKRAQRAIARSPIAVTELLRLGDELAAHKTGIREIVNFSDETETEE